MGEISSSGSDEGPSWATARPTLQFTTTDSRGFLVSMSDDVGTEWRVFRRHHKTKVTTQPGTSGTRGVPEKTLWRAVITL